MPTYLQYEVLEVPAEAQATYEQAVAELQEGDTPPDPPEPEAATKTLTSDGEARLVVHSREQGYQSIALGLDGVSKVEVLENDPAEEAPAPKSTSKSKSES
jgi:hypothetical protein